MRCRPGDLAVVVGPGVETPGLLGRFVIVEEVWPSEGGVLHGVLHDPYLPLTWVCRSAVSGGLLPVVLDDFTTVVHVPRRAIADAILRPIRPNEGEDESLSWAVRPGVTVKVEDLEEALP
jgi:hypothetical protein